MESAAADAQRLIDWLATRRARYSPRDLVEIFARVVVAADPPISRGLLAPAVLRRVVELEAGLRNAIRKFSGDVDAAARELNATDPFPAGLLADVREFLEECRATRAMGARHTSEKLIGTSTRPLPRSVSCDPIGSSIAVRCVRGTKRGH